MRRKLSSEFPTDSIHSSDNQQTTYRRTALSIWSMMLIAVFLLFLEARQLPVIFIVS